MKPYPKGPSFDGSLAFCPNCYPMLGMNPARTHMGDLSRDFETGYLVELFDEYGHKVMNIERAVFPLIGTPLVQEMVYVDGRPLKCGQCHFGILKRIRLYPGLQARFDPRVPEELIAPWLRPKPAKIGVPE